MSASDRATHQLALNWRIASGILIVIGLAALGGAGYTAMTPGVEEQPPQEVDVKEFEATLNHSAVVQKDNSLYNRGDRLLNQPRYTFQATPELTLSAVASVPDDRKVTVSHELLLLVRASADGRNFLERERLLVEREGTVSNGRFVAKKTVNASALQSELNRIREDVGTLGTVSSDIRLLTTYETESTQGTIYQGTLRASGTLQFSEVGYWLSSNFSAAATERSSVGGGVRELSTNWLLVGVLGGVGFVSLLLAALVAFRWRARIDVEEVDLRIERAQHSEWISDGDFPMSQDAQYVYIDSLEGIVDIAIDTNKRVIYDEEIDAYAVADDDLIYYYALDSRAVSSWLDIS